MATVKKVLFIAYFFPPLGGAGVQRSLKFVKYLPLFGWEPTVLTQRGSGYKTDLTLADELPADLKIFRAATIETSGLIAPLGRLGIRKRKQVPDALKSGDDATQNGYEKRVNVYGMFSTLKEFLINNVLVPDAQIGWLPGCYLEAAKLLSSGEYDALVTTASPTTSHLVGALLKKRYGIPWLADFRDEWTNNPVTQHLMARRRRSHEKMEKWVLDTADAVVAVSQESRKNFGLRIDNSAARDKVHAIYNGFDKGDFPDGRGERKSDKFVLSYVGTLVGNRQANDLWVALNQLVDEIPGLEDQLQVNVIGSTDKMADIPNLKDEVRRMINLLGYLPHAKAVEHMCATNALLLVVAKEMGRQGLSGKIFEYLATGNMIIGVVPPESESAKIIRQTNSGVVVPNESPAQLAEVIKEQLEKWRRGESLISQNRREVEKFERRVLTKQLSDILHDLSHENPGD